MQEEDQAEVDQAEVDQAIPVAVEAVEVLREGPPIDHTGPIPQCINTQTARVLLSSLMVIWVMVNITIMQLTEKEFATQTTAMVVVIQLSVSLFVAASFAASVCYLPRMDANLMNQDHIKKR